MNELDKRLDKIEQQLQLISSNQSPVFGNPISSRSDEIDLRELFMILWQGKWIIIAVTFLFAVAGVFYALSLPNMYKSEGVYAPAQKQGGAGALGGQLGGLASLAGVNIGGGESNDIDQAMELIKSWPFLEGVINKHNLKPLIMGVKGWNKETGELVWDEEVYDPVNKKWIGYPANGEGPSSFDVFLAVKRMLRVSVDSKTGLISITCEALSPALSLKFLDLIVDELNLHFKARDVKESARNINYLQNKVGETSIAEMQSVFYGMIELEIKNLMLAEVSDEYTLKTVVASRLPEEKSRPRRGGVVLAFFAGAIFFGVGLVFVMRFIGVGVKR